MADSITLEEVESAKGEKGKEMTEGSHRTEQHNQLVVEIFGTLNLRFKNLNTPSRAVTYQSGWTDSFCHRRCMHEHRP
jgi:hypothetical protein